MYTYLMDNFFDKSTNKLPDAIIDHHELQDNVYYEGDSGVRYDSIFFEQLVLGYINGDIESEPVQYNKLDEKNQYKLNSLGFRGPEFSNVDLLFAGCSVTFGVGLPEEGIYGSMIAKNYSHSYNNLSLPGKSVEWIVYNIFSYFKIYGHPKKLVCLFPNFSRQQIISDKESFFPTSHGSPMRLWITDVHHTDVGFDLKNKPKYSKSPHNPIDVIPLEMAIYSSFKHIQILEQYCKVAGINFLWSTWDAGNLRLLSKLQNEYGLYKYFVDFDLGLWKTEETKDIYGNVIECRDFYTKYDKVKNKKVIFECHEDYKNKFPESFYRGTDIGHGVQNTHKGVHFHAHFAEAFIKEFDKRAVG